MQSDNIFRKRADVRGVTGFRLASTTGSMDDERDLEIEIVNLRRWRAENVRQDAEVLRNWWRAMVRSHALLDMPFYTPPPEGELRIRARTPTREPRIKSP